MMPFHFILFHFILAFDAAVAVVAILVDSIYPIAAIDFIAFNFLSYICAKQIL